jgi:hypothetical protein
MRQYADSPRSKVAGQLLLLLRLFSVAVISLWVLDVLVNLQLVWRVIIDRPLLGSETDYLGVFVAEIQIGVAAAFWNWLLAFVTGRFFKNSDPTGEAVALLGASLVVLAVLAGAVIAWSLPLSRIVTAFVVSVVVGLVVWVVMRRIVSRPTRRRWTYTEILQSVIFPVLVVGFVVVAVAGGAKAAWPQAATAGGAALILFALALLESRIKSIVWHFCLGWAPVVAAVVFAALSCAGARSYGQFSWPSTDSDADAHGRPDIILIVLDTVRADHLESYGYSRDTMPALKHWAQEALLAKRAISPAGWTAPAHASLFSGRTVSGHGIHKASTLGGSQTDAYEGIEWLPEILAKYGYCCLAVTANPQAVPGNVTGFERVLRPDRSNWQNCTLASLVDRASPLTRRIGERLRWQMPYVDAREMAEITKRSVPDDNRPLFLFVNFMDAHSPFNPPASALRLIGARPGHLFDRNRNHRGLTRLWKSLPAGKNEQLADLYDGELRWLDLHLEKLLRWIDERFGKQAVVIITSDHGEELGEDGRVGHEFGLAQSLIHVPLIVRSPDLEKGELEEVVSIRSLFGFIRAAAAGDKPGVESLMLDDEYALISERYASKTNARDLGSEYDRHWVSLFEGGYKAVGPSGYPFQLYDMQTSGFDREMAVSNSPVEEVLKAKIDRYWETESDKRIDKTRKMSDEEIKRLRSLGYIQ